MSLRREQEVLSIFFSFQNVQKQLLEVLCKKDVIKQFAKSTKKHLFWSLLFIETETPIQDFPVNFAKILRKSFLQNIFGRHLLHVFCGRLPHFIHKERERDVVPKFRDHYLPLKHTISKA